MTAHRIKENFQVCWSGRLEFLSWQCLLMCVLFISSHSRTWGSKRVLLGTKPSLSVSGVRLWAERRRHEDLTELKHQLESIPDAMVSGQEDDGNQRESIKRSVFLYIFFFSLYRASKHKDFPLNAEYWHLRQHASWQRQSLNKYLQFLSLCQTIFPWLLWTHSIFMQPILSGYSGYMLILHNYTGKKLHREVKQVTVLFI